MPNPDQSPNLLAILVTGPVGVGKTTTAIALSELLERAGIPHAMIDMDHLRWIRPTPSDDPFNTRLGLQNLALVAASYVQAGITALILSDVIEHPDDRVRYEAAIPGARVAIVRLRVDPERIVSQLLGRERGDALAWALDRAPELEGIMNATGIGSTPGDLVVDVDDAAPETVAREIAMRLGLTA